MNAWATFSFVFLICVPIILIVLSVEQYEKRKHAERSKIAAERFGERVAIRDSALTLRALNALKIDQQIAEVIDKRFRPQPE